MADDEDAIYVDVIARLDEASADEAAGKLRDKFKDVAKNAGDSIKDATKSIGKHVKEYLDEDVKNSIKDIFGTNLRDEIERGNFKGAVDDLNSTIGATTDLVTGLGEAFGANMDGIGEMSRAITDNISDIGNVLQTGTDKVYSLKHGIESFKSGDVTSAINHVHHALRGLVPDRYLDTGIDKISKLTDTIKAFKSRDAAGGLSGISGLFGGVDVLDQASASAGAAQAITSAIGEFVPAVAAAASPLAAGTLLYGGTAYGAYRGLRAVSGKDALDQRDRQDYANYLARGGGKLGPDGKPISFEQYVAARGFADLYPTAPGVSGTAPLLGSPTAEFDASTAGPAPQQPSANEVLLPIPGGRLGTRGPQQVLAGTPPAAGAAPMAPAGGGGGVTHAQEAIVEAASAVISAGSIVLGGISLPPSYVPGSAGHGNVAGPSSSSSSGSSGIPGGFKSWYSSSKAPQTAQGLPDLLGGRSSGGMIPGNSPGYDNTLGSVGGKSIGLEGGEFIVNPKATRANRSLLEAINSGSLSHFDGGGEVPTDVGTSQPPPTQGNTYTPQQQQSLGHGQGLGVSGGAIGLAEQAGAMAAGAFSFGGGAIAAQIAEQEMNLAIQKGGQIGAAAAMAPVETFMLGGGQMGAPSVQKGGWYKKIVGGLLGQQNSIPNVAGATQPPKPPKKDGEGQDGAPGDEQEPGAQGQKPGVSAGPKGSQDDPMHVKVTNPAPPPPQGTTTSAASMTGTMSAMTV